MRDVTIPAIGMAMTEAVLLHWVKQPGDTVVTGDVVAEIETDKSVVDLESPADGTVGKHLVGEGDTVPVGNPVVWILGPGETEPGGSAPAVMELPAQEPAAPPTARATAGQAAPAPAPDVVSTGAGATRPPHRLSPRQRQLARLNAAGDSAETAALTGVRAAVPSGAATTGTPTATTRSTESAPPFARDQEENRARRAVAAQVSQSWREIPHFAVVREIDAGRAEAALATLRTREPAATHTDLLVRALALALRETVGGAGDIGLAVATPAGVMMPVITEVPDLDPARLVAARRAAVQRARNGRLNGADVTRRPLASLSNLGTRGVDSFTGVIAVGQLLLLTVGRIRPRPVALDGGIYVRPTLTATLNVDHRSYDGDRAADVLAAFDQELGAIRAWLEGDEA